MTDVELDARVTALEENSGGNSINGTLLNFRWIRLSLSWLSLFALFICNLRAIFSDTIAFHTVLTSYDSISIGSAVLFNEVLLNKGNGCVL